MSLAGFLHELLFEGRIHMQAPPAPAVGPDARNVLRQAYDAHKVSIAGPLLPFDEKTALAGALLLERAAWYFLNPGLPIEKPEMLNMPGVPMTLEQHLSADLVLRFAPTIHRRARAMMKEDALPLALEKTLREWPLSGVLADIVEEPLTAPDFGAHAGLNFLYAERLAEHERATWFPSGIGMQYVELVWSQLGKDVNLLPRSDVAV